MTSLVEALVGIAIRIGRWLVKRLARWAVDHVVGYMLGKCDDFRRRIKHAVKAGYKRRAAWLRGRIARWTKAATWIAKNALKELHLAAKEVCKLPRFKELPLVAHCEKAVA